MSEVKNKIQTEHREREHFFSAAKLIAVVTLVSRIFGLFRDMGITALGANRLTDAYGYAFQVPNLFRRLFGEGALSSAFVPVFTEINEKEGPDKAAKLLANAFGWLALCLAVLLVAGEIIFYFITKIPNSSGTIPEGRVLMGFLGGIMLPYMFTVCLLALCSAALNCKGHFAYPAAAPIIFNIIGIIAAWFVAPHISKDVRQQLTAVAVSVVIAGIVQLGIVLWLVRKYGFTGKMHLRPLAQGLKPIVTMLVPMLLPLGFLQLTELLQTSIAWNLTAIPENPTMSIFGQVYTKPLDPGVITRLNAARAFYQFPMGVLAISLGVAVFPLLSRYAARNDTENLRNSINRALRLSLTEGMATGVGLFILAEPIIAFFYKRRNFTETDAVQAAFILKMYVIGMWAYCSYQILVRSFYACKDTKTPMRISCCLAVFNLALLWILVWVPGLGAGAFGLSTTITFVINAAILFAILRNRLGAFGASEILKSVLRSAAACAVMAAVVYAMRYYMSGMKNLYILLACIPAGAAAFICTAWLLRAPELKELLVRANHAEDKGQANSSESTL